MPPCSVSPEEEGCLQMVEELLPKRVGRSTEWPNIDSKTTDIQLRSPFQKGTPLQGQQATNRPAWAAEGGLPNSPPSRGPASGNVQGRNRNEHLPLSSAPPPPGQLWLPASLPGWLRLHQTYSAAQQLLPVLLLQFSFQGVTPVPQTPPSISFQITPL